MIENLQANALSGGTVVRWSVAAAFVAILKSGYPDKDKIVQIVKSNEAAEEKNSIKKIYLSGLKK